MEDIKSYLTEQAFLLEDFLRKLPVVRNLDKKKEINPTLILQILVGVLSLVVYSAFPELAFTFYTLVSPCRNSLKVLKKKKKSETREMLTYWVVYALVLSTE